MYKCTHYHQTTGNMRRYEMLELYKQAHVSLRKYYMYYFGNIKDFFCVLKQTNYIFIQRVHHVHYFKVHVYID